MVKCEPHVETDSLEHYTVWVVNSAPSFDEQAGLIPWTLCIETR